MVDPTTIIALYGAGLATVRLGNVAIDGEVEGGCRERGKHGRQGSQLGGGVQVLAHSLGKMCLELHKVLNPSFDEFLRPCIYLLGGYLFVMFLTKRL